MIVFRQLDDGYADKGVHWNVEVFSDDPHDRMFPCATAYVVTSPDAAVLGMAWHRLERRITSGDGSIGVLKAGRQFPDVNHHLLGFDELRAQRATFDLRAEYLLAAAIGSGLDLEGCVPPCASCPESTICSSFFVGEFMLV